MKRSSFLVLIFLSFMLLGCQNLADENDKLRKQISELQMELVAVKTDKKILEERLAKIEAALPPKLRETLFKDDGGTLQEEGLKQLENITDRIPSRNEIIKYLDRNIASLVAEDPREGNAWRVTKISFIPPDTAYVDFTDTVVVRRILLQYSLDQETGINTKEIAIFHKQGEAWSVVSGKDVDHGGSLIIFVKDPGTQEFEEQIASIPEEVEEDEKEEEKTIVLVGTKIEPEEEEAEEEVVEEEVIVEEKKEEKKVLVEETPIPSEFRAYENSWHGYRIGYPKNWYYWGMGQVSGVLFRTGFSPEEVVQGEEAIVVDIIKGSSLNNCISSLGALDSMGRDVTVAGLAAKEVDFSSGKAYVFQKSDSLCLLTKAAKGYTEILNEMVKTLRFLD